MLRFKKKIKSKPILHIIIWYQSIKFSKTLSTTLITYSEMYK